VQCVRNSSKLECVSAGYRAVHCQLAFALFMQTQLPCLKQTCAFDPVFTVLDESLLNEYQIKVSVVRPKIWYSTEGIATQRYSGQLPQMCACFHSGNYTVLLTGA